jgi:hypothetical protein
MMTVVNLMMVMMRARVMMPMTRSGKRGSTAANQHAHDQRHD